MLLLERRRRGRLEEDRQRIAWAELTIVTETPDTAAVDAVMIEGVTATKGTTATFQDQPVGTTAVGSRTTWA